MKRIVTLGMLLLAATAPLSAAQLYRWVDEKGKVEWRDTPPPSTAKKVERRNIGVSTIEASELPYSVQQAVKNYPVTLWLTECGDTCNKARAHLDRRGVPYTERHPQSDVEAFKKASGGGMEVPLLFVGSNQLKGYLESDWDAALDTAGYPKTALTAAKPKPKTPPPVKGAPSETPPVKLYTNAECGAQCAEAKELLATRGVKFQEMPADEPPVIEELKKISGGTFLPTLAVGRFVVRGLDPSLYHSALDEAGYKRSEEAPRP